MLAGVTRIVEICFIAPKTIQEGHGSDEDGHSDHTLAETSRSPIKAASTAFQHLPPFVSVLPDHDRICGY